MLSTAASDGGVGSAGGGVGGQRLAQRDALRPLRRRLDRLCRELGLVAPLDAPPLARRHAFAELRRRRGLIVRCLMASRGADAYAQESLLTERAVVRALQELRRRGARFAGDAGDERAVAAFLACGGGER